MKQMILAGLIGALLSGCILSPTRTGPVQIQRVVIAGDSTAADYPVERINQIGWGQALPYYLPESVSVLNLAVNGRSTRSFINEGKWAALVGQLRPGDLVLISFGHNDARDDAPDRYAPAMTDYKDNLQRFVVDVRRAGGRALILSPAARRLWEGPAMVETHGLYRLAAERAARDAGAGFIDLSNLSLAYFESIGPNATKDDYVWITRPHWKTGETETLEDNTHFSFLGACGVARLIALALEARGDVDAEQTGPDAAGTLRPTGVKACALATRADSLAN